MTVWASLNSVVNCEYFETLNKFAEFAEHAKLRMSGLTLADG
jgi:hypothetical protein